jgi:hypothetical protein
MASPVRVVVSVEYGGFSLSRAAFLRLRELGHPSALSEPDIGEPWDKSKPNTGRNVRGVDLGESFCPDIERTDPLLLQVVDELGQRAAGQYCVLGIATIPHGIEWQIEAFDGSERVAQKHETWTGDPVR